MIKTQANEEESYFPKVNYATSVFYPEKSGLSIQEKEQRIKNGKKFNC